MRKMIITAVAAASLTGGAVAFAALAPIGIASAQDQGQQQTAPDPATAATPAPLKAAKTKAARRAKIRARLEQGATSRRDEVATFLGITPDELTQQLRSGKSVAEIAGPKTQSLIEMLTTKVDARIDAALAAKKIDADRAATLKTKAAAAIERLVNAKRRVGTTRRTG
jgi:hypothetical protein